MRRFQSLRLLAVFGFTVMGLLPAAGMADPPYPTEFGIYVPHNSPDRGAHNDVTVGPCTKVKIDGDTFIEVSFKAGNPPDPVPVIKRIRVDHKLPIDLGGGGKAGAGRVIGNLHTIKVGNVIYVTFDGFISGWWSYDYQPKIVFPAGKPLIVCVVGE